MNATVPLNPYVGPRPFERQDHALFFGRETEVSELLSFVVAYRSMLMYSQSGAGKTSLLNAGLIPSLEREGFEVLPVARVRGLPASAVEQQGVANIYIYNTVSSIGGQAFYADQADADPAALTLVEALAHLPRAADDDDQPQPRALIFDQFEELFTFYPEYWTHRRGFFEQVRDALLADNTLRVLFAMREDFIAQLDPYTAVLPEKLRQRYRLERLREPAALRAAREPLQHTRLKFAPGVAEQLIAELVKIRVQSESGATVEVAGEFVEPVQLQVVCQSLWESMPPEATQIADSDLRAYGSVNTALASFYQRCVRTAALEQVGKTEDELSDDEAEEADEWETRLRTWFETHLITPAGTRGTVYRGETTTADIPNARVDTLERLHIIRGEWRAGSRWYELTHDRFINPIIESNREYATRIAALSAEQRASVAQKFIEAQEQVRRLRAEFNTGQLTRQMFEDRMRELLVLDENNVWWSMGVETDRWYRYEDNTWIEGTPLALLGAAPPLAELAERIGSLPFPSPVYGVEDEDDDQFEEDSEAQSPPTSVITGGLPLPAPLVDDMLKPPPAPITTAPQPARVTQEARVTPPPSPFTPSPTAAPRKSGPPLALILGAAALVIVSLVVGLALGRLEAPVSTATPTPSAPDAATATALALTQPAPDMTATPSIESQPGASGQVAAALGLLVIGAGILIAVWLGRRFLARSARTAADRITPSLGDAGAPAAPPPPQQQASRQKGAAPDLSGVSSTPGPLRKSAYGNVYTPPAPTLAELLVEDGVPALNGAKLPLTARQTVIGRASEVDIRFEDYSISRQHCIISYEAAQNAFQLTDQGSTVGTQLNGRRLMPYTPVLLHDGDEILLGGRGGGIRLRFSTREGVISQQRLGTNVIAEEEFMRKAPRSSAPASTPESASDPDGEA